MRFETPDALGAWASSYNVSRVAFHADGSLKSVVFGGVGLNEASDVGPDAGTVRPHVDRALARLVEPRRESA